MDPFELLAHVRRLGGRITAEQGRLRVNLPQGLLTPELKAKIAEQKEEILRILASAGAEPESRGPAPVRVSRSGRLPLSFAQQRIWFLHELIEAPESYNVGLAFRLRGELDLVALQSALDALWARHELLRARFVVVDGSPFQEIADGPAPRLRPEPLTVRSGTLPSGTTRSGAGPLAAGLEAATQALERPFDFAKEPPVRVRLWRLTDTDHLLLLVQHHTITDGWSVGVLKRDLASLYSAAVRGARPSLPDLTFQYADFAAWQRRWLEDKELDRLAGYWKAAMSGAPPLEMPLDRPRPRRRSYRGGVVERVLDEGLTQAVDALGRSAGASPYMTLLAALGVLLQRYTRQDDLVVGSPIGDRGRPEFENLTGCFLNLLVLRTDASGDPSFLELLERVRRASLGAFEHQGLPFERLVEILGVKRDLSVNPVFQVSFAVQNAPGRALEFSGLTVDELELPRRYTNYDLDIHVMPDDGRLRVAIAYDTDIFEAATIEAMGRAFETLVRSIVADPRARISSHALVDASAPFVTAGARGKDVPPAEWSACIHERVKAQAARTPGATAVRFEGASLSYAGLVERAGALAARLSAAGVANEDVVGLCAERGLDMPASMLAILTAGGAYLPIDPSLPVERVRAMLEDSGANYVLTQGRLAGLFEGFGGKLVFADDAAPPPRGGAPARPPRPEDLAYVIYTSGSTGKPKGVEVAHGSVVNFLTSMREAPGFRASDALLAVTTLSFDIAGLEIFLPLTTGGCVEIVSKAVASDGDRLRQALEASGATVMQATPATWQMLLNAGWKGDGRLRMLCGGEALPRALADELLARGGELWNMYGPTETTIWSAVSRVDAGDAPITIGGPIANTQLLVLDAALRAVPPGLPGELYIAGAGLARGYRNRAPLTSERFVASPRPGEVPGRLYRTGDCARFDAQGRLRFLGRADDQVKLRGFRIELGEIEAVLGEHPGVRHAAAVVVGGASEDARLAAYWIPRSGQDPGAAELRKHLEARLPDYMVPAALVKLDAFPLSPAGKVNRRRLAELHPPSFEEEGSGHAMGAPRDPVEEVVAAAFREVLGRERVGIRQDFFEIGGNSLLATRLLSRLRSLFQIPLTLSQVFESPSVVEIGRLVKEARGRGRSDGGGPIPLQPRGRPLPLSFAQNRLWVIDQMGGGSGYNIRMELELDGPLDKDALQKALDALVERHETLRTRFVQVDGEVRQAIDPPKRLPLTWVDRRSVKSADRARVMAAHAAEEDGRPYDLESGPLLRATVLGFDDRFHVLSLAFHHIVADGWSFGLLRGDLAALYDAFVSKRAAALAPLPVQYADFAAWQRERLTEKALDEQLAYWKRRLGGELPTLALPTDRPRPPVQSFSGAVHRRAMGNDLHEGLTSVARERQATLAMVCLAGFQALLARYTGQRDLVVGIPVANRTREEIEGLIGFFVNSLVMRADASADPPFADFVRQVRDASLEAYDHQDLPFERLVDEIDPARDASRTPIFQVVFAMHASESMELDSGGLRIRVRSSDTSVSRFDVELHVFEGPAGLETAWVYSTSLFDAPTIARMARHYETLLRGAVKSPASRLSELPLLSDAERAEALDTWNATDVAIDGPQTLHGLVEAQARQRPGAVAALYHGSRLTYAELDARANRVARALRRMGVERGELVGLCAHRGLDMVAGLLGIVKAGAAYVPLDPAYPADRLAFMLTDAGVKVLVTQEPLLASLPPHGARVLCLDRDRAAIDAESEAPLDLDVAPSDLAYAIYTSGSTGTPKAALLPHLGLCNVAQAQARAFDVKPESRVLQFASLSFDACTFDVVMALTHGATLCLGDREELLPGPDFLAFLRRHAVEIVTLPPTALAATPHEDLTSLRVITVAGEACPSELVERWAPGRRFFNLYGPTEATIWSTMAELRPGDAPHIGRPIDNTRIYVLDAERRPVPPGVPGEMYIGGVGLARGYHGRPALTAERFVENPFVQGERLYKTGDLVRRRDDGNLEFLGRADHQVKLRGYRIELGEIEGALNRHPEVVQSLALVREDLPGDRRLVAYVVRDSVASEGASSPRADWESDHVSRWQSLYEGSYGEASTPADATFNITAWDSSYTKAPLPADEMRAWVDETVEAILATRPERVLEIGCGMGLLLFRIAPRCQEYHGVDFSKAALAYVERNLPRLTPGSARVKLEARAADDLAGLPEGRYDTIVLNSVVQYFPSADYLARVLEGCVKLLRPGGRVFVGDVRSLPLLRAFHASVQRFQAKGDLELARLRQRVHQQMNQDQELVVHPEFFLALRDRLPKPARVAVEPKRGRYDNELGRFRYDVVLSLDTGDGAAPVPAADLEWGTELASLDALRERLRQGDDTRVVVRRIPNRRVLRDVRAEGRLFDAGVRGAAADLDRGLDAEPAGVDPDDLRALARELPFACGLTWSAGRADGSFDAVFRRRAASEPPLDPLTADPPRLTRPRPYSEYANRPLHGRAVRELVPGLRQHLASRLPEYMVPSAFVVLDAFPVTPNGKIDRAALPAPDSLRAELAATFAAPKGDVEERLAAVWSRVLNVERVGALDNFFELGGDSILSIHVVAAAREVGLHFAAKDLFQNPTVAGLAKAARAAAPSRAEQGPVLGDCPLTPIQKWFFELDLAEPHHFNQAILFEAAADVEPARLRAALARVVNHHDSLRLRFKRGVKGWTQEFGPPVGDVRVDVHDLTRVPSPARPRALEEAAARLQASLDLSAGLLLTAAWFRYPAGEPPRLLIVAHHLGIDAVSWTPLLQDLERALGPGEVRLPPKTASFRDWARGLAKLAGSAEVASEARRWLDDDTGGALPLPTRAGVKPSDVNVVGSAETVEAGLAEEATRALLTDAPAALGADAPSLLVSAFARALAAWSRQEHVLFDVEGHGRGDVLEGVDVSRTAGWFTAIYPVSIPVKLADEPGAAARAVHAVLHAVPRGGLPFGLARYLAPESGLTRRLRALPRAEVAFNYLGHLDAALGSAAAFRPCQAPIGPSRSPKNRRAHLLEVNGGVLGGRLRMELTYGREIHDRAEIEALARAFERELAAILDAAGASARLASAAARPANEFGWTSEDLDELLSDLGSRDEPRP